jgi:hypothetical protein
MSTEDWFTPHEKALIPHEKVIIPQEVDYFHTQKRLSTKMVSHENWLATNENSWITHETGWT